MQLNFTQMSYPMLVLIVFIMILALTPIVTFVLLEFCFFIEFIKDKIKGEKL